MMFVWRHQPLLWPPIHTLMLMSKDVAQLKQPNRILRNSRSRHVVVRRLSFVHCFPHISMFDIPCISSDAIDVDVQLVSSIGMHFKMHSWALDIGFMCSALIRCVVALHTHTQYCTAAEVAARLYCASAAIHISSFP